jgi:hypothetical protein
MVNIFIVISVNLRIYISSHCITAGMIALTEWLLSEWEKFPCFVCLFARAYFIIDLWADE